MRDSAANFSRARPNDLGVVAAHAATAIRAVVVVLGLRSPGPHNLGRSRSPAVSLEQVFAVGMRRAMLKSSRCQQVIRPLLGVGGELIGPDERLLAHARSNGVVSGQDLASHWRRNGRWRRTRRHTGQQSY